MNCPDTNSPKRVGHQNADFELPNENGNSDIQRKEIVSSTSIGRALITSANIKTTTMSETSTDAFITKYSTTDEINYFTTDAGPTEKTDTQNSTVINFLEQTKIYFYKKLYFLFIFKEFELGPRIQR